MRFIVHGAGALGCLVGGRLAAIGAEVVLVGRQPHISAITDHGLEFSCDGNHKLVRHISAYTSLQEVVPRPDDLIFLAVKSTATPAAVQELRDHFGETTPLFCLQNGVRNEELAARRFLHVYGIMAGLVVRWVGPRSVAQILYNDICLGGYPLGCEEAGQSAAAQLAAAGFNVTVHESIMAVKWSKLVLNLNNATLAILGCYLQLAMARSDIASIMAEVVDEGLRVLGVAGIPITDPTNPYNLTVYAERLRQVRTDKAPLEVAAGIPVEDRAYPSTWTDLHEQRGETEASFLNGEIVRLGERVGVPTPFNSTLLEVVERMAAERTAPGAMEPEQLRSLVAAKARP